MVDLFCEHYGKDFCNYVDKMCRPIDFLCVSFPGSDLQFTPMCIKTVHTYELSI